MATDLARSWLAYSAPVTAARAAGRPLVALESTILAHGMPYPDNVHTARAVEGIVRDLGAEPATIALIDGRIRIGLADDELELLGRSGRAPRSAVATCRRCWRAAHSGRRPWAGTMICAAMASALP